MLVFCVFCVDLLVVEVYWWVFFLVGEVCVIDFGFVGLCVFMVHGFRCLGWGGNGFGFVWLAER